MSSGSGCLREPCLARGRPQAVNRAAIARVAGRARKVAQQVGLVLLRIVGQWRPADRAGSAHHGRDAVADFRIGDHRLEYVGRALGIADQHEARCAVSAGMAMIASRIWRALLVELGQRIDLELHHVIAEAAHVRCRGAGRLQPCSKHS